MDSSQSEANLLWSTLRSRNTLQNLAISESGFLFDPASGQSYSINRSAQVLLRLLQQQDSLTGVIEALKHRYTLSEPQARVAVEHFLQQLGRYL